MCIPWIMTSEVFPSPFRSPFIYLMRIHWKIDEKFDKFDFFSDLFSGFFLHFLLSSNIHGMAQRFISLRPFRPHSHNKTTSTKKIVRVDIWRTPYLGKGTFAVIVNQTEAKAKTPSTDSQFLIPGFPASKLRAEKLVLSSYGLKLSNGKGKVIKNTYTNPL